MPGSVGQVELHRDDLTKLEQHDRAHSSADATYPLGRYRPEVLALRGRVTIETVVPVGRDANLCVERALRGCQRHDMDDGR